MPDLILAVSSIFALMYMAINPTQCKRHPRRAESPMERVAQGKRSGTLGM